MGFKYYIYGVIYYLKNHKFDKSIQMFIELSYEAHFLLSKSLGLKLNSILSFMQSSHFVRCIGFFSVFLEIELFLNQHL